jgi:hypothetical protein
MEIFVRRVLQEFRVGETVKREWAERYRRREESSCKCERCKYCPWRLVGNAEALQEDHIIHRKKV